MRESAASAKIINQIKAKHVFAMKIADRWSPGIPDIYVAGGSWIESKVIKMKKGANWHKKLTTLQHEHLKNLTNSGDYAVCYARFEIDDIAYNVFVPYYYLCKHEIWSVMDVLKFTMKDVPFDVIFDRNIDRKWFYGF